MKRKSTSEESNGGRSDRRRDERERVGDNLKREESTIKERDNTKKINRGTKCQKKKRAEMI